MEVGRVEHRTDPRRRPLELGERPAEDERAAARWPDEPEQHAQRRRLAGSVRAEETGDAACFEVEGQIADRRDVAEALGQPDCGQNRCHAADAFRSRRMRASGKADGLARLSHTGEARLGKQVRIGVRRARSRGRGRTAA
jgi:hypothetical protein